MVKLFLNAQPDGQGRFQLDRDFKKRLVKVMRLHSGDSLEVFASGHHYECKLSSIQPDGVELQIIHELSAPARSGIRLNLAQAIPKGERFDWLIQKGTELGIHEIFPLITERTIVRPSDTRLHRWNEIALHAAGQSENAFPPLIHPAQTLQDYLMNLPEGLKLFLYEKEGGESLKKILADRNQTQITYLVGPEGGWTDEESQRIEHAGFHRVHLGKRILRSETAGLALTAIIQYEVGDFSS